MRRGIKLLLKVFFVLLLLSLWGFYTAIRPFKVNSELTPANFQMAYENISFTTTDNVLIRGWFIKNKNPKAKTIILMHGYPADKGNILPITKFLHRDYHLLYFDFRYLGESGGRYSTIGHHEVLELQAAIQYLKNRGIGEVGVWGFSMGGAVALMGAPLLPEIKAIVSESSYARLDSLAYDYYKIPGLKYVLGELMRFHAIAYLGFDIKQVSPEVAAAKINIPVLLIHSREDQTVDFEHAKRLEDALKNNPHLQVLYVDQGGHGEHHLAFDRVIAAFFAKNL